MLSRRNPVRALTVAVVAAAALVAATASPASASVPNKAVAGVGTDGDVLALDNVGDRVWVGGRFSNVGIHSHAGVVVDEGLGTRTTRLARVRYGTVRAAAKDLAGGWLIGGDFTEVSSFPRRGVARILSSGFVNSWNPDVAGTVRAIAYAGDNVVYLGGDFTSVGGQSRQNLAAVRLDTGAVLPWAPQTNGTVETLSVVGSTIYVGGAFSNVGGAGRQGLAAVSAGSGDVLGWNPSSDGAVEEVVPVGSTLYVGGSFSSLGGAARRGAGAVDLTTGAVTAWAPDVAGSVRALAARADGTSIFLGGSFTTVQGQARANVAEVKTADGTVTAFDPGTNGVVHDLDLSRWRSSTDPADSTLYLAGEFTQARGVTRYRTAGVNTATGGLRAWHPSTDGPAHAVARSGTGVYVGGDFLRVNGAPASRIAAVDARTRSLDRGFAANVDGEVKSVAASPDGAVLYVGGDFTTANGQPRRNLAAFDGTTGALLPFDPSPNAPVRTVAASATHVYAGGGFSVIGGVSRPSLAAIKRSDGQVDRGFDAGASGVDVVALSTDETKLYVGGSFQRMGGQARPGFAEISATTGRATTFAPTTGGALVTITIAPSGGRVWLSTHSNRLYAYDPAVSNAPVWQRQTSGDIQGMAASATELYVGGHFSSIKGQGSRLHAASLTTADGVLRPWNPNVAGIYGVWAVVITPSGVLLGGDFEKAGDEFHPGLAHYVGTA